MPEFSHLHVHTQYSLLDGAASISNLLKTAGQNGMKALAITDHGNMFGVPKFVSESKKAGILPVIGCEFYLCDDRHERKSQVRYHQLILAKNQTGYKNLAKLSSLGFIEGFFYKPRIDKALLKELSDGLIATTCCLASEVNKTIINRGETEAEKVFLQYLEIFGEDYYIELQRHGIEEQDICNEVLLRWSKKHNVKVIATNDVHYVNMKDSEAQDILLCLQTGKDLDDPGRMRFENNQFFLKSPAEMEELFKDIPESLDNTGEIISKIETVNLTRDILLPIFSLPPGFVSEDEYLRHLTYEGATIRYVEITQEIRERLDFELEVISNMKFAGYFLIVQDFVAAAKQLGVSVGPGRGSAAGSAVAFCTGITNIDPILYNLLFERFLNPERVSMPDIDIDFDDEGRDKVIDYVVRKYGKEKVAQIVTFGTMAARSAIRDVARVLSLPLPEADRLAKLVPEAPGTTLRDAIKSVKELALESKSKDVKIVKTLNFADVLEGSPRHTGIHAAGIIIAPEDIVSCLPVCTSKESELLITQYDGKYVESVGMLKMDFLGLKTLTIIDDTIELISENHGVVCDIEKIPLDDPLTFELYKKGDTIGTFQFESEGMRAYLKELKPNSIEDLIAMNALYRPGPMDFIPRYIACKNGRQKVEYPHEMLEEILRPTYGIMVYQEQIMQAAQIMGGFSLGKADLLRRAMGKKQADEMERQKAVFVDGAAEKGVDAVKAEEVFGIMAKFAEYGFNRSHSAAYSLLAYQTAWLKANYPAEYMAAVLTNNMSDLKKVTFFMEESRRLGIPVLGPDVNESGFGFTVNKDGGVRFGLGAIKGVGELAVQVIVDDRNQNGKYSDIFDLCKRINLRNANKRCLESMAQAGAFECFESHHRRQYLFADLRDNSTGIDTAIRFGNAFQESNSTSQPSLFSDHVEVDLDEPVLADVPAWSKLEQLKAEKEVTGIYISGHPLDEFRNEMNRFCNVNLDDLKDLDRFKGKEVTFAGIVTDAANRTTKTGKPFGTITLEDFTGTYQIALFSDDYTRFKNFIDKQNMAFLYVKAKIQPRYNNENQFEIKVLQIFHLAELYEKEAKTLTIETDLENINESFISQIDTLIKSHSGKCQLIFKVNDREYNYSIVLPSLSKKLKISRELIGELENITGCKHKIS